MPMSFAIEGTYFENCSCDVLCPCITSPTLGPADQEHCLPTMAFHVASGEVEGLDVSGHTIVLVAETPAVMSEGNWRVGLIIDDAASDDQATALTRVFGGELGGPMAAFAPLIGELLGVERAPLSFEEDGTSHRLKVGDMVHLEVEDYVVEGADTPMTLTGAPHPANSTLTIAHTSKATVNAFGMSWDNAGKNGHSAPFNWSA
jgi:hypothetical protein